MLWVKVSDRTPEPGKPVIAAYINEYGRSRWARAVWIPSGWAISPDFGEYEGDDIVYNEQSDTYFWPMGWYEWDHNTDMHYRIGESILYWAKVEYPVGM